MPAPPASKKSEDPAFVASWSIARIIRSTAINADRWSDDEVPCEPDEGKARPTDMHVTVTLVWTCPNSGALRYRLSLFQDVDPSAQHLVSLKTESGKQEFALDKNTPELALSGGVPSKSGWRGISSQRV
jgi:hypothetical protein